MRKQILLVDGYNIINAWPDLQSQAVLSLEQARDRLNFLLGEYAAVRGLQVMVIYDAYRVKTFEQREFSAKHLKVIFTRENQTADSYIEKFINEHGPKRSIELQVATDDAAEQSFILAKGAARISTRELLLEVQACGRNIQNHTGIPQDSKNTIGNLVDEKVLEKLERIRKDSI